MRTPSAFQDQILDKDQRATHVRVFVDRTGSADWVDLTTLEGHNWFESADYGDDVDAPCVTATVQLRKSWYDLTLATLVDASKLNASGTLIDTGKAIKIETAVMPMDTAPAETDWEEVFNGHIDIVDWAGPSVVLQCRDLGNVPIDRFIETQQVYGSSSGTPVEEVMQDILDDHCPGVTLYSVNGDGTPAFDPSDSPGWDILSYKQSKDTVMSALRRLAEQIGWEVKYRWHEPTDAFQLVFYDPERPRRARGTLTFTGNPSNNQTMVLDGLTITAKSGAAVTDQFHIETDPTDTCDNLVDCINEGSKSDVARAFRVDDTVVVEWIVPGTAGNAVVFTEALSNVTADGGGVLGGTQAGTDTTSMRTFGPGKMIGPPQKLARDRSGVRNVVEVTYGNPPNRTTVLIDDPTSIATYGRRFMGVTEAASSQIDTVQEAMAMANAMLSDLREPNVDLEVPVPYFPLVETGDSYTFEATPRHFDTDQQLAIVGYRHSLTLEQARTSFVCRGQPSGGFKRWLSTDGRRGVAPPVDHYQDAAADNPAATAGLGTVIVTYDDPRAMEVPVNDWAYTKCYISTSNGFTPSASNLAATGRTTRFEINGLVPGTTYYAKLEIVDEKGNVAATSTQVSVATERVGPYHENTDGQQDQLLRNNDFNIHTKGLGVEPDFWAMSTGAYGIHAQATTTSPQTGNYALELYVDTGNVAAAIDSELIPFAQEDLAQVGALAKVDAGASEELEIHLRWFDQDRVFISADTVPFTLSTSFQEFQSSVYAAPNGTRYVSVRLASVDNGNDRTVTVDRVGLVRAYALGNAVSATFVSFSTSLTELSWESGDITADDIGVTHVDDSASLDYNVIEIVHPGIYLFHVAAHTEAVAAHDVQVIPQLDDGGGYNAIGGPQGVRSTATLDGGTYYGTINIITQPLMLHKGDRLRARFKTSLAAAGGRLVYLDEFSVRQLVRLDQ